MKFLSYDLYEPVETSVIFVKQKILDKTSFCHVSPKNKVLWSGDKHFRDHQYQLHQTY